MTVGRPDLPLTGPEKNLTLSAQTGRREANRHSALPERLLARREQSDQSAQDSDPSSAGHEQDPHGALLVRDGTGSRRLSGIWRDMKRICSRVPLLSMTDSGRHSPTPPPAGHTLALDGEAKAK